MNELRDQVQMAQRASEVLENDAFKTAISQLKAEVVTAWKECPVRDREGQLLLLQLAKLADKFESRLVGMIELGKMAQHKLSLDEERNESGARRMLRKVL